MKQIKKLSDSLLQMQDQYEIWNADNKNRKTVIKIVRERNRILESEIIEVNNSKSSNIENAELNNKVKTVEFSVV